MPMHQLCRRYYPIPPSHQLQPYRRFYLWFIMHRYQSVGVQTSAYHNPPPRSVDADAPPLSKTQPHPSVASTAALPNILPVVHNASVSERRGTNFRLPQPPAPQRRCRCPSYAEDTTHFPAPSLFKHYKHNNTIAKPVDNVIYFSNLQIYMNICQI
jgi:hypothetical protein